MDLVDQLKQDLFDSAVKRHVFDGQTLSFEFPRAAIARWSNQLASPPSIQTERNAVRIRCPKYVPGGPWFAGTSCPFRSFERPVIPGSSSGPNCWNRTRHCVKTDNKKIPDAPPMTIPNKFPRCLPGDAGAGIISILFGWTIKTRRSSGCRTDSFPFRYQSRHCCYSNQLM